MPAETEPLGGAPEPAGPPDSYRSARRTALAILWILFPAGLWLAEFGPAAQPLAGVLRGLAAAVCVWCYATLAVLLSRWPEPARPASALFAADAAGLAAAAGLFATGNGEAGFGLLAAMGIAGLSLRLRRLGRVESLMVTTAVLHMAAGAAFLALLGPGIAQSGGPVARAALGAALILLAWGGWSILHPVTRRIPLLFARRLL